MAELPVKGMAHITGGGLVDNVPRVLPPGTEAVLRKSAWPQPPIFAWLQREGGVAEAEMHRVFNCGIGMAVVVAAADANRAASLLSSHGEAVYRIGEIVAGTPGAEPLARVV
jgi:phosphoribosylformylglycinamidine cyclo-ligase